MPFAIEKLFSARGEVCSLSLERASNTMSILAADSLNCSLTDFWDGVICFSCFPQAAGDFDFGVVKEVRGFSTVQATIFLVRQCSCQLSSHAPSTALTSCASNCSDRTISRHENFLKDVYSRSHGSMIRRTLRFSNHCKVDLDYCA